MPEIELIGRALARALLMIGVVVLPVYSAHADQDPWAGLAFLEGEWAAHTTGGSAQGHESGSYSFVKELKGHVLARHSQAAGACSGPKGFDCEHTDLLYVFQPMAGQPLKAIYLDNEGHVISYNVTAVAPQSAEFVSEPSTSGPQFRLSYQLTGKVMYGKFQMRMPGNDAWKSYLEWSGEKMTSEH